MSELGISEFQLDEMRKNKSNLVIVDLRKKEDFAKGHIKGSIIAQYDEKNFLKVNPDSIIVLVGYEEEQARKIAKALRTKNLDVYYLKGGIKSWINGLYCTNISYVGTNYP